MTFGEKLQFLRKAKSLSQEQLAAKVQVSRQAISKWELGETLPDTNNIILLSKILEVSTDYLLLDELDNNSNESVQGAKTSSPKWAASRKAAFPAALCICVIGLIISFIGWKLWQTLLPVGIGIIVQIIGIGLYEILIGRDDKPLAKSARLKFYPIACWLVSPFPVWWLTTMLFQFYPRPYTWLAKILAVLAGYLLVNGVISLLLHKYQLRNRDRENV